MNPIPDKLFLEHNLFIRVFADLNDGSGMRHLKLDQPIGSTPHALTADGLETLFLPRRQRLLVR